jgi:hypothetical protein
VEKFHGKAMEVGVEPLQYGLAQVVVVVVLVQQHLLLLEELEEL